MWMSDEVPDATTSINVCVHMYVWYGQGRACFKIYWTSTEDLIKISSYTGPLERASERAGEEE